MFNYVFRVLMYIITVEEITTVLFNYKFCSKVFFTVACYNNGINYNYYCSAGSLYYDMFWINYTHEYCGEERLACEPCIFNFSKSKSLRIDMTTVKYLF